MKIAITSQNRRKVTAHAGRCRRFWLFDVENGQLCGRELLELDKTETLHAVGPAIPRALQSVDVLISSGMCENLLTRLNRHGIEALTTQAEDPDEALRSFLTREASPQPA